MMRKMSEKRAEKNGTGTDSMPRERNSNIELLRITAMLLILIHHYCVHGGVDIARGAMPVYNRVLYSVLILGGRAGTAVFMLISGYYMIRSRLTARKVLLLWGELFFYSAGLFALVTAIQAVRHPGYAVGLLPVLRAVFPVLTEQYWYFTSYFIVLLLSPFLNRLLSGADRRRQDALVLLLLIAGFVGPTVFTGCTDAFAKTGYLMMDYLFGALIRLREGEIGGTPAAHFGKAALSWAAMAALQMLCTAFPSVWLFSRGQTEYYYAGLFSLPGLAFSVEMFLAFLKMRPRGSKRINRAAAAVPGIYMIHDHTAVRPLLWQKLFRTASFAGSPLMILHLIACVAGVYLVCSLIDAARAATVGRLWSRWAAGHSGALRKKGEALAEKIMSGIAGHL